MIPTLAQARVITQRGANLLVAASAGSGKTEVLARRCVALVSDPAAPCDIDQLLVVTFTRAAAAEMRARIARMLAEQAATLTSDAARARLLRQRLRVDGAEIATIDAWCGRLVREHYAAAGVDPGFRVLDEVDAALLQQRTVDELLRDVYAVQNPLFVRARAWLARRTRAGDDFLREWLRRILRFEAQLVDPPRWRNRLFHEYSAPADRQIDAARARLAAALDHELAFQAAQLPGAAALARGAATGRLITRYAAALAEWRGLLAARGDPIAVIEALHEFKWRDDPDPLDRPLADELKRWFAGRLLRRWDAQRSTRRIAEAPEIHELSLTLLELSDELRARLELAKRQSATLEFDDVLRRAHDLLTTRDAADAPRASPLALRLQQRYAFVLVDEFQDTSPLQVELIERVTRTGETANGFFVGDVKQSIYGFRQAEPRLFMARRDDYAGGRRPGEVVALRENFRSHPGILRALNPLFAALFDPQLGGVQYDDSQSLIAQRAELPNPTLDGAPRVSIHVLPADADAREADTDSETDPNEMPPERIEREAAVAAREIRALLDARAQVLERGPDGAPRLRALRRADIVILLRAAEQNAPRLAARLRQLHVPATAVGRESPLHALETQDVLAVLRLICNRRQDLPLLAYLRGPLVELREPHLLAIREAAPRLSFFLAAQRCAEHGSDSELRQQLAAALTRLDEWARLARHETAAVVVRRILRDGELVARARGVRGGEHRAAMLRALEDLAREFAGGQAGVAEFLAQLEALESAALTPPRSPASAADDVRVMTVHAAKGLEFPVVLLMNCGARFRRSRDAILCDEPDGLGLRFVDYPRRRTLETPAYAIQHARQAQRDLEEELRLLYVALTRARERLLLIGCADASAFDDWSARAAARAREIPLITRLDARSTLDWVLSAVAASGVHETARDQSLPLVRMQFETAAAPPEPGTQEAPGPPEPPPSPPNGQIVDEICRRVRTLPDLRWARRAAALSVSQATAIGGPPSAAREPRSALNPPRLAPGAPESDGRRRGAATHRFLMHCDLRAFGAPARLIDELQRLSAARLISPADAALLELDDLAWLAASDVGRELHQHAASCRRELPLVYAARVRAADEHVLVRGVIDCVYDTPAGLQLLDYKTDRIRDDGERAERQTRYARQLLLYAGVAGALLNRPLAGARLVFLHERRVLPVPVESPILARVWQELELEAPSGAAGC